MEFKLLLTAGTPPPSLFAAPGRVRVGHRPGGGGAIATRYPLVYAALGVGLGRWSLRQG